MENSNRMKELQRKLQYYKTLIEDYEKTKQELDEIEVDKPKFAPPVQKQNAFDFSQKQITQRTCNQVHVSKFNSKYVLNKTKGISSLSNNPFQNNMSVQYKNSKTTLINQVNFPKNDSRLRVQLKNSKTTLINKINAPKNDLRVQVQFKNPKTTLINKINIPKNDLKVQVQFKNPKTTLINKTNIPKNKFSAQYKNLSTSPVSKVIPSNNPSCSLQAKKAIHERNLGLKLDILSPKCSTEPYTKNNNSTGTARKEISIANTIKPTKFASKIVDMPKVSQNNINTVKTLSKDSNLQNCSSKLHNPYLQLLNDIVSVTKEIKNSNSCKSVKSSIATKTDNTVEQHPLTDNRKVSVPAISSNLTAVNKNRLCMAQLQKSNPVDDLKSAKLREIRHLEMKNVNNKLATKSSTTASPRSNLFSLSSTSLSKANEAVKAKRNSNPNRKVFSSQYKVVNKNSGSCVKLPTLKLVKNKAADAKSLGLLKMRLAKQYSPKLRNVLNTKYKIINKTTRNSMSKTSLQSSASKKIYNVHKLVNNSSNSQNRSFNLQTPGSDLKRVLNKTPKMKAYKVVNIKPNFKLTHSVKNKANTYGLHHKNPVKRPRVLNSQYKVVNKLSNSQYKVVNKLSTPKRSIFVNKAVFQINSQKKPDRIQRFITERMARSHQNSTPKPILLKRLYKSKNKIINKNSSPVTQTAKMIKTKYVALYKQRSLPPHKQFIAARPQRFGGHHLRLYYNKPRHAKHGYYSAAFHNPRSTRFLSRNRYSKINMQVKRSSFRKQRFVPAKYAYRSKFATGHGKTFYKNSKLVAPVSQILASRVLHRSINQAVVKSARKNLKKVNTYCMFYNRFGKCNKGIKCSFIHDPSKIAVCTRFLRGTCKSESCPFSHEISPGKMALCTYYLLGSCKNDKCPYRHEALSPNSDLCKEFVQGYCPKGRKCDKAHILICPHYVKGDCDKGDKCLFPHPPQKAKKSTPQDVKEITHAKESEELFLENVNRYFQTISEESASSSSSNSSEDYIRVTVRRSRLLPEQPSFIPLSQSMDELDGI